MKISDCRAFSLFKTFPDCRAFRHSVLFLFPELGDVERGFIDFYNFILNFGKPVAAVLLTTQEKCRMCWKALVRS